tara:strand:+ start:1860 stop:2711 length:852 start_codon:yes stop_codon:yes gene_type:complete
MHRGIIFSSGLLLLALCSGCANSLFYYPTRVTYSTPAARELDFEDVYFSSKDGTLLHGWLLKAQGKATGTVIHFHGNAQNLTAHFWFVDWLPKAGFNLFVFDYRGYGQSEGTLSRKGIYEDCVAAVGHIGNRPDIDADRLILFGQSLGGALALAAVGRGDTSGVRAIAVESTFYSYRAVVGERIGRIPIVGLLRAPLSLLTVGNRYSPGPVVDRVSPVPLLIIHGTDDRIVPVEQARRLFRRAREPKELWIEEGGYHGSAFVRKPENRRRLVRFFKSALADDS